MRPWSLLLVMTIVVLASVACARAGDREIAEQIAHKLKASGQLQAYNIRVKVENGTARLRGRVASQQQMNAAVALAKQTEGVEQIANDLSIWIDRDQRPGMAPIASRQPVDPVIEQARLVPRPAALAPMITAHPPLEASAQQRLVDSHIAPPIGVVDQTMSFHAVASPQPPVFSVPVRSLEYSTSLEALPCTVQKAGYWSSTGQMHVMEPHLASTLSGAAESMLLPDDCGPSAGEAFASDGTRDVPAETELDAAARNEAEVSISEDTSEAYESLSERLPGDSPAPLSLIQRLPEPTRRTWDGTFRQRGIPTVRAVVESQP